MEKQKNKELVHKLASLQKEIDKLKREKINSRSRNFWLLKKLGTFFIGTNLKRSILNFIDEFNKKALTKDTLADLTANIIKRLTRVGAFALILAVLPTLLLYFQNRLINIQNTKIEEQTKLFETQTRLLDKQNLLLSEQMLLSEASRRSAQTFIMGEVLSDVNKELSGNGNNNRKLSNTLVGRIISLSRAMKPYKFLKNDTIISKPLSPERGQLLLALTESKIDEEFLKNRIYTKADFRYADLENSILDSVFLYGANLNGANLKNSRIRFSNLNYIALVDSDLSGAIIQQSQLYNASFMNSILKNTVFGICDLRNSHFENADLTQSIFANCNLENTFFQGAIIDSIKFGIGIPRLSGMRVNRKDWMLYIRDSLKLRDSKVIMEHYTIDSIVNKNGRTLSYQLLPIAKRIKY
jgi:uncharacterized protein YjbI with pentapeptide repeats